MTPFVLRERQSSLFWSSELQRTSLHSCRVSDNAAIMRWLGLRPFNDVRYQLVTSHKPLSKTPRIRVCWDRGVLNLLFLQQVVLAFCRTKTSTLASTELALDTANNASNLFWSRKNFRWTLIFRKFNFRHRASLRKLNPNENNRLYGTLSMV